MAAIAAAVIVLFATAGSAVQPDEMIADPALEARAREISRELRCLVCQNQSIDDSDAELARDLRVLVRERLSAGDSNRQVLDYVVSRYGDFVLLKPPFKATTWILWLAPAVFVVGGGVMAALFLMRRAVRTAPPALSEDEERRLAELIEDPPR
jgi:cytochrome c-type biogenesis protein CcmH